MRAKNRMAKALLGPETLLQAPISVFSSLAARRDSIVELDGCVLSLYPTEGHFSQKEVSRICSSLSAICSIALNEEQCRAFQAAAVFRKQDGGTVKFPCGSPIKAVETGKDGVKIYFRDERTAEVVGEVLWNRWCGEAQQTCCPAR